MKFNRAYTLKEISQIINSSYIGADNFPVLGMNEIHVVEPGDIVFVDHPKYYDKALNSAATIVLINKEVECPEAKALLISDDPFRDFNKLTNHFKPFTPSSSTISPSAKIGTGTVIQPNCFIGNNVSIGNNCIIHSNVSIYDDAIIGDNVIIHAGTVLGASAFYISSFHITMYHHLALFFRIMSITEDIFSQLLWIVQSMYIYTSSLAWRLKTKLKKPILIQMI